MSPTLVPLHALEPGSLSAPSLVRKAKTMYMQSRLHSRSASNGGLGQNTIVFIIIGVVCFLVILIGFFLVSRSGVTSNASPNASSTHQPSPLSQSDHDTRKRWTTWRLWRRTTHAKPDATTPTTPTSQPSPTPVMLPQRPHMRRGKSKTHPPITTRPSHSRRPTDLSVATSFPHAHVSEEAWSDLRASAYDLDVDLESEMLHSAREDCWVGHSLALEGGMGVEEAVEERGNAVEGDDPPTRPVASQLGGGHYENVGACNGVASTRLPKGSPIENHTR